MLSPKDIEKEITVANANDEKIVRDFVKANGGTIDINEKFIEIKFPVDVENSTVAGQHYRGHSWHNLRVSAMHQGRFIFG